MVLLRLDREQDFAGLHLHVVCVDQAEERYTKAIELDIRLAAAYANRALVRLKLGNPTGAEADCDHALLLQPTHVKALLRRASARSALSLVLPLCAATAPGTA